MPRLTINDITDESVKPVVTDADLLAADEYLADLAASMDYTLVDVPAPLPYKVKRLLIAFVCREVCARKAGGAIGMAFKGQDAGDKWSAKLPYFAGLVRDLEAQITPEVLTGHRTAAAGTIEIGRA